jgi:lipid-binding SYLF domain-containing protein
MSPKFNGVPKSLFEACIGIILISVVEVGFIFSGNVGTGIALKKNPDGVHWSPPVACGLTGVGWGFLVGGSVKDLMVFVMDEGTLNTLTCSTNGLKLGAQAEVTLGPLGRTYASELSVSAGGLGSTVAIAFSKGAFLGLSVKGAVLGIRHAQNAVFYGRDVTPDEIMNGDAVILPSHKVTLLDEIYAKLGNWHKAKRKRNSMLLPSKVR